MSIPDAARLDFDPLSRSEGGEWEVNSVSRNRGGRGFCARAEYDKSRYKAYPGGGKWRIRAPCCSADDAWRRDTIAFPDSRIICQRPSDTKNSKSILSYVPTICSRSSIIRQQCRWPTRAGSFRSESLPSLLFSSPFFCPSQPEQHFSHGDRARRKFIPRIEKILVCRFLESASIFFGLFRLLFVEFKNKWNLKINKCGGRYAYNCVLHSHWKLSD